MEIQPDFRDLLVLLSEYRVEYAIVGGYALAFHGAPRYTGDLDILVSSDSENAERLMNALDAFGFGAVGLSSDDFRFPDRVVQLGFPPVRIDIATSVSGVTWEQIASDRVEGLYGDVNVFYIGRVQFVQNKRATGRKKDLADLEALGEDI